MPGSSLQVASVISDLEACRSRFTKKASFEAALQDVARLIRDRMAHFALPEVESKLLELLARCVTLLKTRYTSLAFWRAGSKLLETASVSSTS